MRVARRRRFRVVDVDDNVLGIGHVIFHHHGVELHAFARMIRNVYCIVKVFQLPYYRRVLIGYKLLLVF